MPAALKEADSTREAQLLESWKAYKKGFQEGIAIFNKKPKKGIAFMQVCHIGVCATVLLRLCLSDQHCAYSYKGMGDAHFFTCATCWYWPLVWDCLTVLIVGIQQTGSNAVPI